MMAADRLTFDFGTCMDIRTVKFFAENMASVDGAVNLVELKIDKLEKIDCSGIQLVYSICKYAKKNHITVVWSAVSDPFKQAMQNLGMEEILFPPE